MKIITPIIILPPTTNSPKAAIMELTASGPLCPSLKIDLVVAIFNESLKSTRIKSSVGKVERSVGRCTNKDIKRIKIPEVKESIRKKSSIPFGKGTTMIANIAKMNATKTYSFLKNRSLTLIYFYLFLIQKIN